MMRVQNKELLMSPEQALATQQIVTHVYTTDWSVILTSLGTSITIIGFIYAILRNFKIDVNNRMDKFEKRIDDIDEKIFFLATGRTLTQAILDEKIKRSENKP